jgi:uncharacterized protein (DUF983 family)
MPEAMVRCRNCRTLLNTDLEVNSVEVPAFVPLPELETMTEIEPLGIFATCPKCGKELKIARKYLGERVACKYCESDFRLDAGAPAIKQADVYSKCPHCSKDLRFDSKYIGQKVACRFCSGKLHVRPVR